MILASSRGASAAGVGILRQKTRSPRQIERIPGFSVWVIGKMIDVA